MTAFALRLFALIKGALRDLLPLVVVVSFFQLFVLAQPFPDLGRVLVGLLAVAVGLALFIHGLEQAIFPLGESMAGAFARKGSLLALLAFAFALGFGTTVAEPTLIAVAAEGARAAAAAQLIEADPSSVETYAVRLRLTVAVAVGLALVIGVIRILKGWPIHLMIAGGYVLVGVLTLFSPREIVALAYDTGGVTTSSITVPLVTALGVGLATVIRGRNPAVDGFGLIAFASVAPMMLVLVVFGIAGGGG